MAYSLIPIIKNGFLISNENTLKVKMEDLQAEAERLYADPEFLDFAVKNPNPNKPNTLVLFLITLYRTALGRYCHYMQRHIAPEMGWRDHAIGAILPVLSRTVDLMNFVNSTTENPILPLPILPVP